MGLFKTNKIQKPTKYYNQEYVIDQIHNDIGYSKYDVRRILNSLHRLVLTKFSDRDNRVEIKIFPGLKMVSEFKPNTELPISQKLNISSDDLLFLKASFSDDFRKKVRELSKKQK